LTVNAGSGLSTFNIQDMPAASASATPSPQWIINGGPGSDVFNIGSWKNTLDTIKGRLLVDGKGGSTDVRFYDQGSTTAKTYTVTPTQLERSGGVPIQFAHIDRVDLYASAADDTFNLQREASVHIGDGDRLVSIPQVQAGVSASYFAGKGQDIFNVGNNSKTLDDIHGSLFIAGRNGSFSTVNLNDQGHTHSSTYTFSTSNFHNPLFERSDGLAISFNRINQMVLNPSGMGQNTVAVQGTQSGGKINLNLAANDSVVVGNQGKLDDLHGVLTVHGQGSNSLDLQDQNATALSPWRSYSITANTVGRTDIPALTYDGLKSLTLTGGAGSNHFSIKGTPSGTTVHVNGGGSNVFYITQEIGNLDTLKGSLILDGNTGRNGPAGSLDVFDQNNPRAETWTWTGNTLTRRHNGTAGPVSTTITFAHIASATVSLGKGDNSFTVQTLSPGTSLSLVGGKGSNTLIGPDTANTWDIIQDPRSTDRPYSSGLVDFVKGADVGFSRNILVHGGERWPPFPRFLKTSSPICRSPSSSHLSRIPAVLIAGSTTCRTSS
jgi:hypothetical protein